MWAPAQFLIVLDQAVMNGSISDGGADMDCASTVSGQLELMSADVW